MTKLLKYLLHILSLVFFCLNFTTTNAATIDDYGQLPQNRSIALSPDGEKLAWLRESDGKLYLLVINSITLETVNAITIGNNSNARNIIFATNKHVIVQFSSSRKARFSKVKRQRSTAYSVNIHSGKYKKLLGNTPNIHFAQTGLGRVSGINSKEETALMTAYDFSQHPTLNLYSVNLNTGRGTLFEKGNNSTFKWHINKEGKIFSREDYNKLDNLYSIHGYDEDHNTFNIYEEKYDDLNLDSVGVDFENNTLFVEKTGQIDTKILELSLETGEISRELLSLKNSNISNYIRNSDGKLIGVAFTGLIPDYYFFDKSTDQIFKKLVSTFKGKSVELLSHNDNFSKTLLLVSGSDSPDEIYLFNSIEEKLTIVGTQYKGIDKHDVADVSGFEYTTADGTSITAVATWPLESKISNRKNLPTIIFPHKWPLDHDSVKFHWWAQYLASQGYLVVQPNYRGSSGFGPDFSNAGKGKWGTDIQNDITDTVNYLVDMNIADENKICIMGEFFGGYSALMGSALNPDKYKCIISVNGISDLPDFMLKNSKDYGKRSRTVKYWEDLIVNETLGKSELKNISPVHLANNIEAPVLLIYSKDNTVVSPRQTTSMAKKLKHKDKDVQLTVLKGEDHFLSKSKTRIKMLKAIDEFLKEHNPI